MRPKGQRESRVHGSMQGFLWLLLIQITVFSAASCTQETTTTETAPTTITEPTPTPSEPTPTPPPTSEETPTTETAPTTITEPKPTPSEPTPTPSEPTPTPSEPTPSPSEPTPSEPTPTPSELTPTSPPTSGNCNEKCQKNCTWINPCQNGGTCSCDATCTITCNCGSSYKGSRCEMGVNIFPAVLRQDAPKVKFDMTVQFGVTGLNTSEQESMLREQFQNLPGFNNVSVSPLNEGTTNDYPVKAMFDYNNNNINKVYNGGLKDEIKNTFGGQERASQGSMTLIGEINQTNVPREDLDLVFQCSTSYEGYILSFNSTGVFCKSPCNDASYCNNHGNCSHLISGPKCSCDPVCDDQQKCTGCKTPESNLFKILFGTLGGLLGVGILLGIVCYCVKHPYPSKSVQPPDDEWYTTLD